MGLELIEACEVLTSGWCPLRCVYCYIPKSDKMKKLHADIVRMLYDGRIFLMLPKNIRSIGLWGTEPTLTMKIIENNLDKIKECLPRLERIDFSTNMMMPPEIIVSLIRKADEVGINVSFQVSLDGPEWITDSNRGKGVTRRIVNNLRKFINLINNVKLSINVSMRWKPTLAIGNVREMNRHPELIHEYYHFFDKLTDELKSMCRNDKLEIINSSAPTLVVPGKYTSSDGKELAKFFRYLADNRYPNAYVFRALRVFRYRNELYKVRMFTCSGGDSNIGFDGRCIHICHRTFYYNNPEYVESILDMPEYQNWDVSHFRRGSINNINKFYIVDANDEFNIARFQYVMRGYHDFWKLKLSITYTLIKELAAAGQVSSVYLHDDKMAEMLSLFINTALSCPMENLLNTGSIHIPTISLIRVFGNGAFEIIVDEVRRYGGR